MSTLPKLNEVAPKHTFVLPSTKERITFTPYRVRDEKVLLLAVESQDERQIIGAMLDVIENCSGIQMGNNPIFDLEYAFLQIRAKSVGESSVINAKCTKCNADNEVIVDFDEAIMPEAKELEDIPVGGEWKIRMHYPTANDFARISKTDSTTQDAINIVDACIDTVIGNDQIIKWRESESSERLDFIDNMPREAFVTVTKNFQDMPRVGMDIKFDCSSCKYHNEVIIEGLSDFFT